MTWSVATTSIMVASSCILHTGPGVLQCMNILALPNGCQEAVQLKNPQSAANLFGVYKGVGLLCIAPQLPMLQLLLHAGAQ